MLKYRKTIISLAVLPVVFFAQSTLPAQISRKKLEGGNLNQKVKKFDLSPADDAFLEDLEKRSFSYFWENSDPKTGLTLDRAKTDGSGLPVNHPSYNIASIAATGFALTSLCVAADRKWVTTTDAKTRAKNTLDFFANHAFQKNGWFYHWLDKSTGERRWNSEISSIDTALLLGGVLTVKQCFADDVKIVQLATQIYERVDFVWMLNDDAFLLSHGWRPETGFIPYRWADYSENSILYLLAIGSLTKPIGWRSWYKWKRQWVNYAGYHYLSAKAPIFIHQYSQAWFDFRNKRERMNGFKVDYFQNSVKATHAHKVCNLSLNSRFPGYSENMWGISAMDSAAGYVVWDCPPPAAEIDGTIAPYVAAASMMFAPEISLPALKEMKSRFGTQIYGRYGFADAFNPNTNWVDSEVIGIDVGIQLLGIENMRSGKIWQWFMQNPETKLALIRAKIK